VLAQEQKSWAVREKEIFCGLWQAVTSVATGSCGPKNRRYGRQEKTKITAFGRPWQPLQQAAVGPRTEVMWVVREKKNIQGPWQAVASVATGSCWPRTEVMGGPLTQIREKKKNFTARGRLSQALPQAAVGPRTEVMGGKKKKNIRGLWQAVASVATGSCSPQNRSHGR
jgi:hypothetical protein